MIRRVKDDRPLWLLKARHVWCEDDAGFYEGFEYVDAAWKRIFGYTRTKHFMASFDAGDCEYFLYPRGHVACMGMRGFCEILEVDQNMRVRCRHDNDPKKCALRCICKHRCSAHRVNGTCCSSNDEGERAGQCQCRNYMDDQVKGRRR